MRDWVGDNVEQPNAAIDLHDSDLVGIVTDPAGLILDLRAYVHRSHGTPGVDSGTGWVQPAAILLGNGRLESPSPELPAALADGELAAGGRWLGPVIPCPFASEGETALELTLESGRTLHFLADRVSIVFSGEPEFVEAYDEP